MATMLYTPEQLERREGSPWTRVQFMLAPIQFMIFLVSATLVVRYLATGEGYWLATFSVWVKITLLWTLTITGMIWEKDVLGHWFMAPQFFWEDVGNLVAIITHNAYFVAIWMGASPRQLMAVMLVAYMAYLINCAQFVLKGIQAGQARRAARAASALR
jgi:3-vinyl bacteriochlorophyllide hydratase